MRVGADTFGSRSTTSIPSAVLRFLMAFSADVDFRSVFAYHLSCSVEAPGSQTELNILSRAESSSPHPCFMMAIHAFAISASFCGASLVATERKPAVQNDL